MNWHDYIPKTAQDFSQDGSTFTLRNGQTLSHVMQAWNRAHPDRRITLAQLRAANPGIRDTKFRAGKSYRMPGAQPAAATPAPAAAPARHLSPEDALVHRINGAIDNVVPFIMDHEGYRENAYHDVIGNRWTVGHGHTRIPDSTTGQMRDVRPGDTLTASQSESLLRRLVRRNAVGMYRSHPWFRNLGQGAMSGALDVAYNAGTGVFDATRSPVLNREMAEVGADPDTVYWRQHGTYTRSGAQRNVPGLVNRRNDAAALWNPQTTVN